MHADTQYLRICAKSLDVRQQALLNVAIEQYSSHVQTVLENDEKQADIIVVDLDSLATHSDWVNQHANQRRIIGLSGQLGEMPYITYVQKPLRIAALQLALHQAHRALVVAHKPKHTSQRTISASALQATQSSKVLEDNWMQTLCEQMSVQHNQQTTVEFEQQNYLHQLLKNVLQAAPTGQAVKIETEQLWLLVTPQNDKVTVNLDDKALFNICRQPLDVNQVHVTFLTERQTEIFLNAMQENRNLQHLDAFIWKTALWAALGRVPKGTDLNAQVRLQRWPNMTRLHLFPHATRIAALWHANAYSLLDTAAILDIPACYVFAFFTAAQALDLIEVVTAETQSICLSVKSKQKNSELTINEQDTSDWLTAMRKWLHTTKITKTSHSMV